MEGARGKEVASDLEWTASGSEVESGSEVDGLKSLSSGSELKDFYNLQVDDSTGNLRLCQFQFIN